MKSMFPEWYRTSDDGDWNDALVRLITEATVAFDASALLELYRSDASERAQILGALTLLGDRLFVPYQAALEYQRRREGAIKDQRDLITSVVSTFESAQTNAARAFNDKAVKARVRTTWETARHAVGELEAALIDEYDLTHDDDDVRDGLDALLTPDRLGSEPTSRQSRKRAAAFEERARQQMPPGYCDVVKGAPKMYGDYFIWCELLDKARASQQPLLFVTEDLKDDWSWRGNPRRELVHEMRSKADAEYHHITLKTFLRLAQKHLSAEITDETIESVSEQPKATIQDIIAASEGLGALAAFKDQNADFLSAVLNARLWADTNGIAHNFYLRENIGNLGVPPLNADLLAAIANVNTKNWWDELRRNNPLMSGNVFDAVQWSNTSRSAQQPVDQPESPTDAEDLDDQPESNDGNDDQLNND